MAGWRGWRIRRGHARALDQALAAAVVVKGQTAEQLYASQPYLRAAVDLYAHAVAQLPVHVYRRSDDDGRHRVRDHPVAAAIDYELVLRWVADWCLYDAGYLIAADDGDGGLTLRSCPVSWISSTEGTPWAVTQYEVTPTNSASTHSDAVTVPAANMVAVTAYQPGDPRFGVSRVETLRDILAEQISAATFRRQLWENGGRIGAYLTRPKDAPVWSNGGRRRFMEGWRNAYAGDGSKVGGVPVLEDGMELKRIGFSAKEEDYVEGSKLARQTIAAVYRLNPIALGDLDNANYSNSKEFRQAFVRDSLGPLLSQMQGALNRTLAPWLGDGEYIEFAVEAKLSGSFEEQAAILATSVGGPWLTRNEARARQNLPAIEGGNELIVPLNLGTPADEDPEHVEQTEIELADAA